MYEVILVAALSASAPVPPPPREEEFRPGRYAFKWNTCDWGIAIFERGGFYGSNYRLPPAFPGHVPEQQNYGGTWEWDQERRVLKFRESPHNGRYWTTYEFTFGRRIGKGRSGSLRLELRLIE